MSSPSLEHSRRGWKARWVKDPVLSLQQYGGLRIWLCRSAAIAQVSSAPQIRLLAQAIPYAAWYGEKKKNGWKMIGEGQVEWKPGFRSLSKFVALSARH